MHPRDSSKNITDTQRQAALPVRQAAAAEMHKDAESVRPASSSAAGMEADRNKHTATGERLSIVGGTTVKLLSAKLRQLF